MFVVLTGYDERSVAMVAVCKTLDAAALAAAGAAEGNPFLCPYILDLEMGVWRASRGRRMRTRFLLAEQLMHAHRTQRWCPHAELVGIDQPDCTPIWSLTLAEYEAQITKGGDGDYFLDIDRAEHEAAVRAALAWNKPIPVAVLADYPSFALAREYEGVPA